MSRPAAAAAGSGPMRRVPAKYTASTPRMAHHAITRRVPVTPSSPYAIAIQIGYPCGNWPVTVPASGSRRVESHEPDAVVVRIRVGRKEEIAHRRRHSRGNAVSRDERLPLRDLDALVSYTRPDRARRGRIRRPARRSTSTRRLRPAQQGALRSSAAGEPRHQGADCPAKRAQPPPQPRRLHPTSALSEYALMAASTNARVVVTMTLIVTAQNRRSSAGSAARFERLAIGARKMTAPGR